MLSSFFGTGLLQPHGFCMAWDPGLLSIHIVSDGAIALAYFSIPLAIYAFLRRKRDFAYRWVAQLFAAFIVLCGTTHALDIVLLWWPIYGIDGLVKAATAVVSVTTAVMLWPMLPAVVALAGPGELREANRRLEAEVAERRTAEAALRDSRDELERRVADRTEELARINRALRQSVAEKETLLKEVHHRVKNNLQSLLALIAIEQRRLPDSETVARFEAMRLRIMVMSQIHANLFVSETLSSVDFGEQLRLLVRNLDQLNPYAGRVKLTVEAASLSCDLDTAVPLGLLVNEIVTNAVKHGFPDGLEGRVHVAFEPAGAGQLLVEVRDDGIGDTQGATPGGGIGKRLIASLARQIGATVSVVAGGGTVVRILFPDTHFRPAGAEEIANTVLSAKHSVPISG